MNILRVIYTYSISSKPFDAGLCENIGKSTCMEYLNVTSSQVCQVKGVFFSPNDACPVHDLNRMLLRTT